MNFAKQFFGHFFIISFTIALVSCGGSSGSLDGDAGDGDGDAGDDGLTSIDTLAVFPVDLAISSPFEGTSSEDADIMRSLSSSARTYADDVAEVGGVLAGTTEEDCLVDLAGIFETPLAPACYGPVLNYLNWPITHENGQLPPFDLGIWNENEGDEACAAAQINHLVNSVGEKVDYSVRLFGSMLCVASVNNLAIPAAGENLDLKPSLESMMTNTGMEGITVNTAILERQEDDAEGHAVYFFTFTGQVNSDEKTSDVALYLKHKPLSEDNSTYGGKLSFQFSSLDELDNCDADGQVLAGSVLYQKNSAADLTYRLQTAQFCGLDADPFNDTQDIDPEDKYDFQQNIGGWVHNYNYSLSSFDPASGIGNFAYAWQAGYFDGNSRVFNAALSEARVAPTGVAYFGYGNDIAGGEMGIIQGFICNWTGPGGSLDDGHATQIATNQVVQRQEMERDEASGVYISTGINITYAPANSCASAGEGFIYKSEAAGDMTNDNPNGVAVTPNLIDMAEMDFVIPAEPADVY